MHGENLKLIFPHNFEQHSNIKFPENLSIGSRVFRYGWTDRHDKANRSLFLSFAYALKITVTKYISQQWHCKDKINEENLL